VLRPQFAREPDMARRFLSEIRLARRITHPNVCRLHEYGERRHPLPVHELIDGVNLKEILKQRRLRCDDAYEIALGSARGLEAVHAQGVIHRDFKTANIMLDARRQVKVMDFGIAKEVGSETTGISLAGHVMGTPEYMSPEHAQGGSVDFRSDIYALGCVIFEVFAGRALFQGTSAIDTLRRHLHQPLVFSSDTGPLVPEPLVPVLTRALAKKPEDRYQSITELIEDLNAVRAGTALYDVLDDLPPLGVEPPPPPATTAPQPPATAPVTPGPTRALTPGQRPGPRSAPPPPARWRPAAAAVALGVIGLLALAWWRERQPIADPPAPAVASAPLPTLAPAPSTLEAVPPTTLAAPPATTLVTHAAPRADRPRASGAESRPSPVPSAPVPTRAPITQPGLIAETASAPTSTAPPATLSEEFGVLNLLIVPESKVLVDGTDLGLVSRREVRLSAGGHAVEVRNPGYIPYKRVVTIRAGIATELVFDLKEKGIKAP
jgi:serine/threonine-protein kinase